MRKRLFELTATNDVITISLEKASSAWESQRAWSLSKGQVDLRLIIVQEDSNARPVEIGLLRVRLQDGWITRAAVEAVQRGVAALPREIPVLLGNLPQHRASENVAGLPEVLFQLSGWPPLAELRRTLAVCLDVPVNNLPAFTLGYNLLKMEHRVGFVSGD